MSAAGSREHSLRELARPYFRSTCASVLDPYLEAQGFRRTRFGSDQLSYRRGRCVLEFSYAPYVTDEQPKYALTAGIGLHRGFLRKPRVIGVWQVPCPDRGGNRWSWEFRGPQQLKQSLKEMVRLLDEYAKPLWEDKRKLQAVIEKEWPIYVELANA